MQFSAKSVQQVLRTFKSDQSVQDSVQKIEKNIANLALLSTKAFKVLTKMYSQARKADSSRLKVMAGLNASYE